MIIAGPQTTRNDDHRLLAGGHVTHDVRSAIEGAFLEALELAPGLAERIRGGTRSERYRGTAQLPNFFRRAHGDGWALVGDAGYHKDPIHGSGSPTRSATPSCSPRRWMPAFGPPTARQALAD